MPTARLHWQTCGPDDWIFLLLCGIFCWFAVVIVNKPTKKSNLAPKQTTPIVVRDNSHGHEAATDIYTTTTKENNL